MARSRSDRAPIPLDAARLHELALRYVGRFATSRAKLVGYLARKVRERGWSGEGGPDLQALADQFARLGYVDDAAYALSKSRALSSRGYGRRRLDERLRIAGIGDEDANEAREHARQHGVDAALRFAERRRIGPFASVETDPRSREKAISAMVRAGHPFQLAKEISGMAPGSPIDREELIERWS